MRTAVCHVRAGEFIPGTQEAAGDDGGVVSLEPAEPQVRGGCGGRFYLYELYKIAGGPWLLASSCSHYLFGGSLEVHLILDNYGTHKHPKVKKCFRTHPRYHVHFTPTSASWLNQVERWFAEITRKRIRRGTFRSVRDLVKAIQEYIRQNNKSPRPFQWVASANTIVRKVRKYKWTLETGD
jgi:transposase